MASLVGPPFPLSTDEVALVTYRDLPVQAQGPGMVALFPFLGTTPWPGSDGPAVVRTLGCSLPLAASALSTPVLL